MNYLTTMKYNVPLLLLLIVIATLESCCFASQKCDVEPRNSSKFRFLDQNGKDLLFGDNKKYNADSIIAYSLSGTDTVKHLCNKGPDTDNYENKDSLLYVRYDYRQLTTVYLMLDDKDIDTIQLSKITEGSKCCGKYTELLPVSFNIKPLQEGYNGLFTIIKKS